MRACVRRHGRVGGQRSEVEVKVVMMVRARVRLGERVRMRAEIRTCTLR